jgi:hypothetical protein
MYVLHLRKRENINGVSAESSGGITNKNNCRVLKYFKSKLS